MGPRKVTWWGWDFYRGEGKEPRMDAVERAMMAVKDGDGSCPQIATDFGSITSLWLGGCRPFAGVGGIEEAEEKRGGAYEVLDRHCWRPYSLRHAANFCMYYL